MAEKTAVKKKPAGATRKKPAGRTFDGTDYNRISAWKHVTKTQWND